MSKPTYVEFRKIWEAEARTLSARPAVAKALKGLREFWHDLIAFHNDEGFPEHAARAELELTKFDDEVTQCEWLLSQFEPCDVAPLELAVCGEKFPAETWEIFGQNEHYVVTNVRRNLVCDLFLCDKVSAATNLALAGVPGVKVTEEAIEFMEGRVAQAKAIATQMKNLVAKYHGTQLN